ncbi:protein kintoun-like [Oppia nitens]|uniref:protein kintoun-like n=1 Tax=Oppia nitens TaxID=1686743 RepID=UPI0023DA6D22|nr:protein kintoun-like [Oppia nitens]
MSNTYESTIDCMINELQEIKDNVVTDICHFDSTQVNVQYSDNNDKLVIKFNLNRRNNKSVESSDCDNHSNDENKEPDNGSYGDSHEKTGSPDLSHNKSANEPSDSRDNGDNQPIKSRLTRRTISESNNEGKTQGILKYSHNWIRRTVSESSCDVIPIDLDHIFDSQLSYEDVYSDDDLDLDKKPKKNVRFNENVSKTVFRPNSSILGRRLKNQKKALKLKNRKNGKNDLTNKEQQKSTDCERTRQDSGYDSEDNSGHNHEMDDPIKVIENCIEIETGIKNLVFE